MSDDYAPANTHSVFDMSTMLESINDGVARWDTTQMFPVSGNMNNQPVGQGNSSGTTTFQWQDAVGWWSPQLSYFNLRLQFTHGDGSLINNNVNILGTGITGSTGTPTPANPDFVTYCDNFVCTLFTQIQSFINAQPLDIVTTPWIIDTALSYSKAHWNFIKTYASLTRLGEPLTTRLLNVTENGGVVEVSFRPPLSLFDVKLLPPGAQFRIDYLWAASAQLAFESLLTNPVVLGATSTTYKVAVQDFSFYKVILQPAQGISLPMHGMIDLCPSVANQYFSVGTTQIQQQITLPGTTNRILIVFQDLNNAQVTGATATLASPGVPVDMITGVGGGYTPATSFTSVFTSSTSANPTFTSNTVSLSQLYIILPELGIQSPKPQYNFSGNGIDYMRAYSDWAHICQGTHDNMEGSIPFGNNDPNRGITINAPLSVSNASAGPPPVPNTNVIYAQPGDPENYQQLWPINVATSYGGAGSTAAAVPIRTLNQLTRWGWSGTRPGPIFAFSVVRPEYKKVTSGTLYTTFTNNVVNVAATVIATYSMCIAVENQGNGLYSYTLVTGV